VNVFQKTFDVIVGRHLVDVEPESDGRVLSDLDAYVFNQAVGHDVAPDRIVRVNWSAVTRAITLAKRLVQIAYDVKK